MTARDRILVRRAQLVAAALTGVVAACAQQPAAKSGNVASSPSGAPSSNASALGEQALAGPPHGKKEKPLDSDGDGIPDADDKCPFVPGSILKEGCPVPCLSIIPATTIVINEHIYFAEKSAKLSQNSVPVLDAIAQSLKQHPEISGAEVLGHNEKSEPKGLGEKRARAVRDALVALGVDPLRLTVRDMGSTSPADNGTTTSAKAKNRRVEFLVLP